MNPLATYRGLSAPPGPKPQKSLKKVSRGLQPRGPPKVWKKSGKSLKSLEKSRKGPEKTFRDFFQTLGGPRARRPWETFFQTFSGSLRPSKWPREDKSCTGRSCFSNLLGPQKCLIFGILWPREVSPHKPLGTSIETWAEGVEPRKVQSSASKKQACFLEGALLLGIEGKRTFLEPPFAS